MENQDQLSSKLGSAQSILIILPRNSNYDQVAAGLALFLSLGKSKKQVSIVSPQEMTVEFSSLVGVDKIKTKQEGRNLMVSFDYLEEAVEKVSYNIEGGKFNLIIQPKGGFPPLSTENVQYSYSGGQTDLTFTIDGEETAKENVVPIKTNGAASISDKIANLISQLNLPIDADIATNLLLGIENATRGFSSPMTNADTFEAVAFCLRAGGRRKSMPSPLKPAPKIPSPDWLEPKIYKGNTQI